MEGGGGYYWGCYGMSILMATPVGYTLKSFLMATPVGYTLKSILMATPVGYTLKSSGACQYDC